MNTPTASPMGKLRITPITIILGLVALCAVACFATQLFNFGGGDDDDDNNTSEREVVPTVVSENSNQDDIELGNVVTAASLDRDGCAVEEASTFNATDSIYVVTDGSQIPEGTSVFVRLYQDNTAVEDADEITADQDYNNVCISFVFESETGFTPGAYEAEFYVNGNRANTVQFNIE
ncbi:MAG: hypothetical protein K8I82_10645 [Anaerolineae bacterium]|nr:hypothetical protein [Anaerolineae bacterium]